MSLLVLILIWIIKWQVSNELKTIEMENSNLILLTEDELQNVNGGLIPLAWVGYAFLSGVIGYFAYEITDGVVKGFSSSNCSC